MTAAVDTLLSCVPKLTRKLTFCLLLSSPKPLDFTSRSGTTKQQFSNITLPRALKFRLNLTARCQSGKAWPSSSRRTDAATTTGLRRRRVTRAGFIPGVLRNFLTFDIFSRAHLRASQWCPGNENSSALGEMG